MADERTTHTSGTWVEPRFDPDQTQYPPQGSTDADAPATRGDGLGAIAGPVVEPAHSVAELPGAPQRMPGSGIGQQVVPEDPAP